MSAVDRRPKDACPRCGEPKLVGSKLCRPCSSRFIHLKRGGWAFHEMPRWRKQLAAHRRHMRGRS